MEGLFFITIIGWAFFIALSISGFFITVDVLYFIFCNERISKVFRLPAEIVVLCIIPAIIVFWSSLGDTIKEILTPQLVTAGCILAVLSYFISSYIHRIFSLHIEIALVAGIISGCIVSIIFATTQIIDTGFHFVLLIGCIPILLLFIIALIQQYRRCKKAYYLKKQLIKY